MVKYRKHKRRFKNIPLGWIRYSTRGNVETYELAPIPVGQQIYLEYIKRRKGKVSSKFEAPPIPFNTFVNMWNDRCRFHAEGETDKVNIINLLLFIEDEYNDDGRGYTPIGDKVQQEANYDFWEEFGY